MKIDCTVGEISIGWDCWMDKEGDIECSAGEEECP